MSPFWVGFVVGLPLGAALLLLAFVLWDAWERRP